MALELQDMLMRLQPLSGLSPPGGHADKSLERKKLELMRQQFEETKRQHAEESRLREMAEAGAMARERMQTERAQQQQAAAAHAKVMDERRAAYGDIYKYEDAGDVEGIENAANRLNESGGSAERLGEDANGMPSWRVETNPERARAEQQNQNAQLAPGEVENPENPYSTHPGDEALPQSLNRMNALGYNTLGTRGNLNETRPEAAEPLSTEDAFSRAQASTAQAESTGAPARGPDAPDFMGGVPKNVVDTGAMAEQTKQRLGPVMANIEASMPEAYRKGTEHADAAALGAGLSGPDALKQSLALRAPVNAAVKDELDTEQAAEKAKAAAAPKELTRKDALALQKGGRSRAKEMFDNLELSEVPRRAAAAQAMVDILEDGDPNNDQAIAFELPNMLGSRGAQSNKDLAVALGIDAMSTTDQIIEKVNRVINGGFTEMRKDSLVGIIKKKMETDDDTVLKFLDAMDEASAGTKDPEIRRGLDEYLTNVPKEYRDAWAKEKGRAPGAAAPDSGDGADEEEDPEEHAAAGADGDFEDELMLQAADAGLDERAVRGVIQVESGGDPAAHNKSGATGLIQFMPDIAEAMGTTTEEIGKMSAAEQVPLVIKYLKDRGIDDSSTQADMYVAIAAGGAVGKPDATVVYKKDSPGWKQNPAWRPADGGDITVGDIKAFGGGGAKKPSSIALLDVKDDEPAKPAAKPAASGRKGSEDAKLLEGL